MPNKPRLIVHLKAIRTAANLTQAQLAERVGVSRKTINTVENGIFVPSAILALQIADALSTSMSNVFELNWMHVNDS